ncbi:MAG: magnesium transporter CorA family protein [Bacteroidales bacterium]|jgi:magnesium transporter|nr:magnesium transporter CorA family protein [Bacteroidales bacterium]HPB02121.1 magnesium transporter CorA family protein [Bacteroidales bacterium]HPF00752.1 magnesium transporter CorA family protein [Bacteroidales bacterium]
MIEQIRLDKVKWLHILYPSDEDYNLLINEYHFHPLDIEDCKTRAQRSKIDIYDDYYFLILHFPYFDKINRFIKVKEIKIFWGEDFIITIGSAHWVIRDLFEELRRQINDGQIDEDLSSSDKLLYRILESLMKETQVILQRTDTEIDLINKEMFSRNADKIIEKISITRKNVILLNTTFKPQLRLFHKFESGEVKGFAEDMEDYWGNILDYYQKNWDMIEDDGELLEGLSKTFDSMQANRTNEIMKMLTFISTTLLPMTFITGLYGMNVALPFGEHPFAFSMIIGIMALIVIFLILYFKRKRWM